MIRKAHPGDTGRIAEILVFNNRINYYPIFGSIEYSFGEYNVLSVSRNYASDKDAMNGTFVFEDIVVRGFICVVDHEIRQLYVDPFFQNRGIGDRLIGYALTELNADHLWALEKNTKAVRFYARHGFHPDGQRKLEEGTTEYLIRLTNKPEVL